MRSIIRRLIGCGLLIISAYDSWVWTQWYNYYVLGTGELTTRVWSYLVGLPFVIAFYILSGIYLIFRKEVG